MRYNLEGVIGSVSDFPGCDQIAVSHCVFLPRNERGKGLGRRAHVRRLDWLHNTLQYDVVMCTIQAGNIIQRNLLLDNKWTFLFCFQSTKTDHEVELWVHRRDA